MQSFIRLILFFAIAASGALFAEPPRVLVSIAPYRYFVTRIAGDLVEVETLVPPGANLHTYEPTPRQALEASRAAVWFKLGEVFEDRVEQVFLGYNPDMRVVELRQGIELIQGAGCCHHHAADLHIWLSARLAKKQAETMAAALIVLLPDHSETLVANLQALLGDLDALDKEVADLIARSKVKQVLVSHPAYGYFCRDYDIEQLAIEHEGKDPTPGRLTDTIERARALKLTRIFAQKQFNDKAAYAIAKEIGAEVIMLDPYVDDYPTLIRQTARSFAGQ